MILISAGHNPSAKGACNGDICEWDIAINWIEIISKHLTIADVPNRIVPTGKLSDKVSFINSKKPDIAIELHFNSNINAAGSETLYYPGSKKGKELASTIQGEFVNNCIFMPDRGIKEGWYKMDRPGIVDYSGDVDGDETIDYFLRKTSCTAVIVEPQFIYNLKNIEQHESLGCLSIATGLMKYWLNNFNQ